MRAYDPALENPSAAPPDGAGPSSALARRDASPALAVPDALAPYWEAANACPAIGPLTGRRDTAETRERRLRELDRLRLRGIPASAIETWAAREAPDAVPNPFNDAAAVTWLLREHQARNPTRPDGRPTLTQRILSAEQRFEEICAAQRNERPGLSEQVLATEERLRAILAAHPSDPWAWWRAGDHDPVGAVTVRQLPPPARDGHEIID